MNFTVFQVDVKSALLNGMLEKEVFLHQQKGFKDATNHEYVYKLNKALYGLKQAPRTWYERLTSFLLNKGYIRGSVDMTLFVLRHETEMLVVQIYMDDIILGGTSKHLVDAFIQDMTYEFVMSMV